jgi:hypothetical protein
MRTVKALLPAALLLSLVALPAAAPASTHDVRANAAGSDGPPPVLPSIVGTRVNRGEKALERAGDYVDRDMPDKAVASLLNARRNMYAAWRGATYVIENAPPPPAEAGSVRIRRKARSSATYNSPEETAVAVLGYQHDVATAAFGLLDGAKGALRDAVSTTMFAALDRRDQAIEYIHNRPAPPVAQDGRVHARTSGAPVAAGFDTLMPGIVPDLDDEIQQTTGLLKGGALTPGEKRIMKLANAQVLQTENTVNTYWPPLPAADG